MTYKIYINGELYKTTSYEADAKQIVKNCRHEYRNRTREPFSIDRNKKLTFKIIKEQ